MAGKTGTSQVRKITLEEKDGVIENEKLDYRLRDHSIFMFCSLLMIQNILLQLLLNTWGKYGSKVAAPIFKKNNAISFKEIYLKMTENFIKLKNLNWLFIFLVSFLCFVGLVMIYSATIGEESKIFMSHICKILFGFFFDDTCKV